MNRIAEMNATNRTLTISLACAGLLLAAMAGMTAGCGTGNPYPPGSYERGAYFIEKENHVEAVAALESFVRHNPTDSLAAEAQYLKALATMEMKEYPLAAVEFQILRKDYPTSARVEDAYFQEGVAYFKQTGRIERDITGAQDARHHFMNFLQRYPQSPLAAQAQDYMRDISDLVVQKRLRQCKVYRQLHRPQAIVLALDAVLAAEPNSRLIDRVLLERGRIAEKVEDATAAETAYSRLLAEYPDSEYADEARSALENLPDEAPTADQAQ